MAPLSEDVRGEDVRAKIKGLYSTGIVAVGLNQTMAETAQAMASHDVGALAVLDGADLVGIVTERDIVRAVATRDDADRPLACDLLALGLETADVEDDPATVTNRMLELGIRHLPVTDHGTVVGMVSMQDLAALETRPAVIALVGLPGEVP